MKRPYQFGVLPMCAECAHWLPLPANTDRDDATVGQCALAGRIAAKITQPHQTCAGFRACAEAGPMLAPVAVNDSPPLDLFASA